jgi:hypothetical protein
MTKMRNESGPCFTAWGTLTNTPSADFINGRFDEEKGVIAAYDYCSYNC